MAAGFVTNYGNSENSGLNWWEAKRTILNTVQAPLSPQYINGYFNEGCSAICTLRGISQPIIDLTPNLTLAGLSSIQDLSVKSITNTSFSLGIANVTMSSNGGSHTSGHPASGINNSLLFGFLSIATAGFFGNNSTFVGATNASFSFSGGQEADTYFNIYTNFLGGITFPFTNSFAKRIRYSYFSKAKFKFSMSGGASNETTFTSPTGTTNQQKIDSLRARMTTVYGGVASDYLVGCEYSDDADMTIFIDPSRNNYYLVPGCLPSKMSYDGKFIGARPEGSFLAFNSSNFTYSNFDSNGNIIDQKIDAVATGNIVDLTQIRTINKLDSLGQLAVRNGNELNINETILPNPLIYTNAITLNRTYKVYNAQITVGAKTYLVGECFIAKGIGFVSGADTYSITGITAGTTLIDLGCYEVEAGSSITYMGVAYTTGQRFQCYADSSAVFTGTGTVKKFDGGFVRLLSEYYGVTGITAGTALRDMQTYEVVGGTSVTYLSVVYTPGKRFTCIAASATAFTAVGGSTLSEWNIGYPKSLEIKASKIDATLSTDVWVKMSLSDTPMVNYDVNGKITFGNLDSGYVRASAQPLSVRYWQPRLTVQSLNIPY